MAKKAKAAVFDIQTVEINVHCVGEQWKLVDFDQLAYLVALIAMGQAFHAANILRGLSGGLGVIVLSELKEQAKSNLTVPKGKRPWIRDGFLFECISWIAAQQQATKNDFALDPHLKATTQGLDGLILKVVSGKLKQATIIEDKCTKNPKSIFASQVMTAFRAYHNKKRSTELLAATSQLLKQANIAKKDIATVAGVVLTHQARRYRASLTAGNAISTPAARSDLFSGFETLAGIGKDQRLGAVFMVPTIFLRAWCAKLAAAARGQIDDLEDLSPLGVDNV